MRHCVTEQIQTPDLMLDRGPRVIVQGVEEFPHGLTTGRITIEDSLKSHLLDPKS
jgi:hypothetical protein